MFECFSTEKVMSGDEHYIASLVQYFEESPLAPIEKEARIALVNFYTLGEGKKREDFGAEHLQRNYYHARRLLEKFSVDTAFTIKYCWILINSGRHKEAI